MASSLNVESGEMKRGDKFGVNPFDIIVRNDLRGRIQAIPEEKLVELAYSLYTHGQRQDVRCRKDNEGRPVLVSGFNRNAAARLIRNGFEYEGQFLQNPNFLLNCTLETCNDREAFEHNIVENEHRHATSPIDDAHNQRRLRDEYNYSDAEIARLYRYKSQNKVATLAKLLLLSDEEQQLVHNELLAVQAAVDLLEAPADTRAQIVSEIQAGAKVSGTDIRSQIRDHILSDDNKVVAPFADSMVVPDNPTVTVAPKKSPKLTRGMKDLRAAFTELSEREDLPPVAEFAGFMLEYFSGTKTDRQLLNAIKRLNGADLEAAA